MFAQLTMGAKLRAVGNVFWAIYRPKTKLDAAQEPLFGKPSIAVLAFDNLTGGATQDYLSDGLRKCISTALARFPDFFDIARNSSFTHKDKLTKLQQIAAELGADMSPKTMQMHCRQSRK